MSFEFRLPDIGEGVVEGEIVRWLVNEGETLRVDQPMVEVMTDKATVEIPSPRAGRVARIFVPAGKMCPVGAVMITIDEAGSAAAIATAAAPAAQAAHAAPAGHAAPAAHAAHAAPAAQAAPAVLAPVAGKVLATPATRKLARDLGVDLSQVPPTGQKGHVTRQDVLAARGSNGAARAAAPAIERRAPTASIGDVSDERIPFRGVRKKIAERMHQSKTTAAHFTYVEECDVTELVALRSRVRGRRAEEQGVKISYLPFVIKAVCSALRKYPIVNSTLDEQSQEIVLRKRYHIGVAAATQDGLIVPVIRDADRKSIFDLARELGELSDKTRQGKASREELTGSTFTISSLGALGGVLATPIINFPEVAVLGVHKIKETPAVRDGQIVIRQIMNLSISLDHRIVDGYEGALFLQHVVELLEDPTLMFMEMV